MRLFLRAFWPFIALIALSSPAIAQWTKIGDRTLGIRMAGNGTAITYIDGHLWTGFFQLWQTTNDGATWIDRTPESMMDGAYIADIEFFDRDHGAFITRGRCGLIGGCPEDGLFITSDGGATWTSSRPPNPGTVTYMGSPQDILVAGNRVETSRDGGVTWRRHDVDGEWAAASVYFGQGKAGILVWGRNATSYLYYTSNYGEFWDSQRAFTDYDCYDMVYDSCSKTLFVVNEEWYVKEDNSASAIISTDMGRSWTTVCSFPYPSPTDPSINGGVDITPYAWYLQTGTIGTIRSTDRGATWRSINGPDGEIDGRTLVVPQDNLAYAIEKDGSIWMTKNGGGLPMNAPSTASLTTLSREELFTDSTVRICGQAIRDELTLNVNVCGTVFIKSIEIVGGDSSLYEILEQPVGEAGGQNKIAVSFGPTRDGHYASTLVVTFLDGTQHTVQLGGTADLNLIPVTARLHDVVVDELGEHVLMELYVEPPTLNEDVIVQISHDLDLDYSGTFTYGGVPLHILPSNGTINFVIPAEYLEATAPDALIRFNNVTAIPKPSYQVTLDSLYVTPFTKGCYGTLALEGNYITVPVECGTIALSRALRNERIKFSVHQDPSKRDLIIGSSHEGHYTVTFIDMLGTIAMTQPLALKAGENSSIKYPALPSGTYIVVVRGNGTVSSHRIQL